MVSVDLFELFPEHYKWVGLGASLLALECFFLGFIYINGIRSKYFTQEVMDKHFGEFHLEETGRPAKKGGYPDTGCGLYADKLTLNDWLGFYSGFRGHMNFVENLPALVFFTLLAGIFYPITAAVFGFLHVTFRVLYIIGYTVTPNLRVMGFLPSMILLTVQIILIINSIKTSLF